MSFGITVCKGNGCDVSDNVVHKVLTCYTPDCETIEKGYVSMVRDPSLKKKTVANGSLVTVPAGAIIDMIEYSGVNSFAATGGFTIGLGQLNGDSVTNLIEGGTSLIANDNVGGCRQFISENENGDNNKIKVPYNIYVNFRCIGGVQKGGLRADIYYHAKS